MNRIIVSRPVVCLLLCVLGLDGCTLRPREPAPDLSPSDADHRWFVHCETAKAHDADEAGLPGVHLARWVRAVDASATPIVLDGVLRDGFLSVSGVLEGNLDGSIRDQRSGMAAVREACLRTLRGTAMANQLAEVRAFREPEGVDVVLDFNGSDSTAGIRRLVVFGDSLTDTGNLKRRMRVFPGPPYWIGRFSNGPTWVDYLAAWSGLAAQNHAYGGASVTGEANVTRDNVLSFVRDTGQFFVSGSIDSQIEDFHDRFLGGRALERPETTAFILWAGANDYISKEPFTGTIDTLLNHPLKEGGYQAIANQIVDTLQQQVRQLYALGARYVLIGNLPDLGNTPIVVQNKTYPTIDPDVTDDRRRLLLANRLSELTDYHNEQLAHSAAALRDSLPDMKIGLFDVAGGFAAMLRNELPDALDDAGGDLELVPNTQTLEIADEGLRREIPMHCYSGGYLGTFSASNICGDVHRTIFWDNVHPTTYTHCWVSYLAGAQMHRLGWTAAPPPFETFKRWCQQVSETALGHSDVEAVLSAEGL